MKTLITIATIGIALFGLAACDSKVESSRKDALESEAKSLENKADTVRKNTKTDAADLAKQAAKSLEEEAKDTREQK